MIHKKREKLIVEYRFYLVDIDTAVSLAEQGGSHSGHMLALRGEMVFP
jgi:hypothetical protein